MLKKSEKIKQVFKFADLSKYTFKQRLTIRLVELVFYLLISIIGKTIRFEIDGWENFEQIERDNKTPIYTFWHNRIFLSTYFWRKRRIVVMTSQSLDGEYISRCIQRLGYGASRGSSTRGGMKSLAEMIQLMNEGLPTALSIDGPKGPKYVAKLGATLLAEKTGHPILPFSVEIKNFWEAKNWDNLQIPKPFSRAKLLIGKPLYVPNNSNEAEIENKRLDLQNALDELVKRGVQWRESEN